MRWRMDFNVRIISNRRAYVDAGLMHNFFKVLPRALGCATVHCGGNSYCTFSEPAGMIVCVPIRQTSAQRVEISGEVASLNGSLWATPPIYQSGHRTHEVFSKHRYLTRPTINHHFFLNDTATTE